MGSILKSTVAMKIGKRHRREGQGGDGSAAMRGYTAGCVQCADYRWWPSQARGVRRTL